MLSTTQMLAMALSAALAVLLPAALIIFWRRKTRAPFSAALVGAAVFFVFALVLEPMLHRVVLTEGGYVMTHPWAYVLYGALAAGVFEETGRLVGFKLLLKRRTGRETGVMCGLGHGGMEAVLLCGLNMITYLILAARAGSGADLGAYGQAMAAASATPAAILAIAGVERVIAICFHTALSVLVFQAAFRPGKRWLFPAAIGLHMGLDLFAAAYQMGIITNIYVLEGIIALFTAAVCALAVRMYRRDAAAVVLEEAPPVAEGDGLL